MVYKYVYLYNNKKREMFWLSNKTQCRFITYKIENHFSDGIQWNTKVFYNRNVSFNLFSLLFERIHEKKSNKTRDIWFGITCCLVNKWRENVIWIFAFYLYRALNQILRIEISCELYHQIITKFLSSFYNKNHNWIVHKANEFSK